MFDPQLLAQLVIAVSSVILIMFAGVAVRHAGILSEEAD